MEITIKGMRQMSDAEILKYIEEAMGNVEIDPLRLQLITNCRMLQLRNLKMLYPMVYEICDCFYLRHSFAAATLTNHLFECMVKFTLAFVEGGGKTCTNASEFGNVLKKELRMYGKTNLDENIKSLCNKDRISKEECERLLDLKNIYRNPFSHASDSHFIKKATTPLCTTSLKNPTQIDKKRVKVIGNPFLLINAREQFIKENALQYFVEICTYLNQFDNYIGELYKKR